MDTRTTIYKKKDTVYNLKMKASRREAIYNFLQIVHVSSLSFVLYHVLHVDSFYITS